MAGNRTLDSGRPLVERWDGKRMLQLSAYMSISVQRILFELGTNNTISYS